MESKKPDLKVKSILISQPEPTDGRSPYYELRDKYKLNLAFRNFVSVLPVAAKDFRKDKVNILEHTAIILTSRASIEHLFRLVQEMRIEMPTDMKYFCVSETIALYLQKFTTYRKRKVFFPKDSDHLINDQIIKHKVEKYLFPQSNSQTNELYDYMRKNKLHVTPASIYKSTSSDLSDLKDVYYDVLAFFSPTGIQSLFDNFPDFQQNNTRIAAFGSTTCQAVLDKGLRLDITAPTPEAPSMKMALELYIKGVNNGK
ncbi:MAG: uroporphyrinogen-III synthase [Bacteroidota bacterium]|nr:uroporphyrinogen-III synthase [Bacteroidota bacterium]